MLALAAGEPLIVDSSVLVVHSNRNVSSARVVAWLRQHSRPPKLRMITTASNAIGGITAGSCMRWPPRCVCGRATSGSSTARLTRASTPHRPLRHCGKAMEGAAAQGAAFLGERFPAPPKHVRFSLLHFVFWPRRCTIQTPSPAFVNWWLVNATRAEALDDGGHEAPSAS